MPLLSVENLHAGYETGGRRLRAVDGVSFAVEPGETVGLVGESGCGKSSLARVLMRLVEPASGRVLFDGLDVGALRGPALKAYRRQAQMVFQDPFASLNPRQSVGEILSGPLAVHGLVPRKERLTAAGDALERVGLPRAALSRYPHEFSGGQRQRLGIARALILAPRLVICDEPVSALDLSIQAQILNLLAGLKAQMSLSYLFISHDLSVVRYFADRVLVMYLGRIVETGSWQAIFASPLHPYTRALIEAVPTPGRRRHAAPLSGDLPSARDVPPGCRFHPRCPIATPICTEADPALRHVGAGQSVACHHAPESALQEGLPI
ncbi:ABC transporter ATP-binding protein [Xanthobacter autotrophicus]|uniref:ABC transporter ATP-binding protein n=1 Tax=Xanthobacter autotrophicus TaxID=280 RepID=UPI0024A72C72|nr:oligopeptide/dipeptide ABC transporter ATP-binding protein [Xanthobacter autotrophicus]MDI4657566.1 ATP-binding cassette domain-containing protein [Xanthobacter autotrophicus]